MNIVTQKYCSRCKTKQGPFINYSTGKTGIKYYRCRACNTNHAKRYRATAQGKEKVFKAVYSSMARNKMQVNARSIVNYHVRKGKLQKPNECTKCMKYKRLEAHHSDYLKPLIVVWLCRQCHADLHRVIGKTGKIIA